MRKSPSPRLNICVLICCCILLLIDLLLMSQQAAIAQSGCPNIPKLTMPHWEPYHPVTVVFQNDSNWSDAEIGVMKSAFDDWSSARFASGTNSGVTFVGFQRGPAPDKSTATHTIIVRRIVGHGNSSMGTVANVNSGGYAAVGFLEWDASVKFSLPGIPPVRGSKERQPTKSAIRSSSETATHAQTQSCVAPAAFMALRPAISAK